MSVQHETELYEPLKAFFERQGYEVKGEVRHCDLVGLHPDEEEPLIVEMKKTFNLSLLLQGVERLKLSPHVYLAVERNRSKRGAVNQRWDDITGLCRRLGVGLITVTFYKTKKPLVEVLCEPGTPYVPTRRMKVRKSRLLYEFRERSGDYNVGGTTRAKLMTAYREKALRVAGALAGAPEGGLSPAHLREKSGVPNAAAILQNNYYGWFQRISRGRYLLTPAGTADLERYAGILETGASSLPALVETATPARASRRKKT
ncbi:MULTISPECIES: DUF2161 domain-containing phosphodiesterase [Paenibacillus]|uniref:Uncharacterized protein n=2 Tax=Paenibacillus TaxID=44249 RepID=A0A1R1ESG5_9BACL|nr:MULTISPECIES: DUF2161 family putative PD-(D/E)XK-type phosphodiesterase [Paenibacillus]OMF54728.1 hypothetical protein BK138_16380 [Paenibacillus rhizosphaerae]OXL81943.1 hypothetical protein BCV73_01810 [Paenibacillus sp. SSG-1]PQP91399.1 hypothetical protein CPT76_02500 [Paenibacillus sp. AR247]UYO04477.1 hypothetical protein K2F33_00100 [Paenibacillus sp. PSB04]GIO52234.1 hypothetical protein J21TS7_05520 [Paenibacillus cineris]